MWCSLHCSPPKTLSSFIYGCTCTAVPDIIGVSILPRLHSVYHPDHTQTYRVLNGFQGTLETRARRRLQTPGGTLEFSIQIIIFNVESGVRVATVGSEGNGPGQFSWPGALALSSAGELYGCDSQRDRIQVFDRQGTYLRRIGGPGQGHGQFKFLLENASP
jgi:hypothetical protein